MTISWRCFTTVAGAAFALALSSRMASAAFLSRPPLPEQRPVAEDYFGTRLVDPYRYMETLSDPNVRRWILAEGDYSRSVFNSIAPRTRFLARLSQFGDGFTSSRGFQQAGTRAFFLRRERGSDTYDLITREDHLDRKLIDMTAYAAAHGGLPHAINYFAPSPDGNKVAVGISAGGSENASLFVIDVRTAKSIAGPVERAQFGPPSWSSDGEVVFINVLAPADPAAPSSRYLNSALTAWDMRNTPLPVAGAKVVGQVRMEPQQFAYMRAWPGADAAVAMVVNGSQNELSLWVTKAEAAVSPNGGWRELTRLEDGVTAVEARDDRLFLLSHAGAPTFQILSVGVEEPLSAAKVLIPAKPGRIIEGLKVSSDAVYALAREGLYSRLLRVATGTTGIEEIPLPFQGSLGEAFADPQRPGLTFQLEGWTSPPRTYVYHPETHQFAEVPLDKVPFDFDASNYVASDSVARALDGVGVPLSLVRPKRYPTAKLVLMSVYGSYGISRFPSFSARNIALMDEGAATATCHVRGGGELGESWRLAGKDSLKPNTWRDLIACAEKLKSDGVTSGSNLFIMGTSAGGIPVGRAMQERPDLFAGVIASVPMSSTVRAEYQTNGPANIPEFGSVRDKKGFRNLLEMDTYFHVDSRVHYPAVLLTTGLNDPRVDSWQPAKLAARLLGSGAKPVLLRVDTQAGHGIGSTKSQSDELFADIGAFMFWRAGESDWKPTHPDYRQERVGRPNQ